MELHNKWMEVIFATSCINEQHIESIKALQDDMMNYVTILVRILRKLNVMPQNIFKL